MYTFHTLTLSSHVQVKSVVHLLLANLDTPSQQVQEAIARCLPPLATVIKSTAKNIIKKLMEKVCLNLQSTFVILWPLTVPHLSLTVPHLSFMSP